MLKDDGLSATFTKFKNILDLLHTYGMQSDTILDSKLLQVNSAYYTLSCQNVLVSFLEKLSLLQNMWQQLNSKTLWKFTDCFTLASHTCLCTFHNDLILAIADLMVSHPSMSEGLFRKNYFGVEAFGGGGGHPDFAIHPGVVVPWFHQSAGGRGTLILPNINYKKK